MLKKNQDKLPKINYKNYRGKGNWAKHHIGTNTNVKALCTKDFAKETLIILDQKSFKMYL